MFKKNELICDNCGHVIVKFNLSDKTKGHGLEFSPYEKPENAEMILFAPIDDTYGLATCPKCKHKNRALNKLFYYP